MGKDGSSRRAASKRLDGRKRGVSCRVQAAKLTRLRSEQLLLQVRLGGTHTKQKGSFEIRNPPGDLGVVAIRSCVTVTLGKKTGSSK